jgi:hypothetical protein
LSWSEWANKPEFRVEAPPSEENSLEASYELVLDDQIFGLKVEHGSLRVYRGAPGAPDARVATDVETLGALVYEGATSTTPSGLGTSRAGATDRPWIVCWADSRKPTSGLEPLTCSLRVSFSVAVATVLKSATVHLPDAVLFQNDAHHRPRACRKNVIVRP